jgi:hypothetical protein
MTRNAPHIRPVTGSLTSFVTPVATLVLSLTLGASVLFTTGCKSKAPETDNSGTSTTGASGQGTAGSNAPSGMGAAPGSSNNASSGTMGGNGSTAGAPGSSQTASTTPPPTPGPPPPPPPPPFIDMVVPAGKAIPFRITQTLDSETTKEGDTFSGIVASNVLVNHQVVIPQGTPVAGRVTLAHEAAHYKGSSELSIELTGLNLHGQHIGITTAAYTTKGKGRGKNTAVKVGGGAAGGALIGGLIGGGKGAAIGAAAGAGTGLVANGVTRGEQVQIASESLVQFALSNPITVSVPNPALNAPAGGDATGAADSSGRKPLPPPTQ